MEEDDEEEAEEAEEAAATKEEVEWMVGIVTRWVGLVEDHVHCLCSQRRWRTWANSDPFSWRDFFLVFLRRPAILVLFSFFAGLFCRVLVV